MTTNTTPTARASNPVLMALYVNAALLLAVLVALITRGQIGGNAAVAAPGAQPIAGGDGVYLMPGQFSQNVWGCYVMDTQTRSLLAYEYIGGTRQLRLVAARGFEQDLKLQRFNTYPDPLEIQKLIDMEKAGLRGKGGGQDGNQPGENR